MDSRAFRRIGTGCTQMATSFKKGYPIESKMGRPVVGSLGSFPKKLSSDVYQIRQKHPGWGAPSILLDLVEQYGYTSAQLPSSASINRYIKEQGLVASRAKANPLPTFDEKKCNKVKRLHDQWELDAKGPEVVTGMGTCAPINIKDRKSKTHCISFPVPVKNKRSQPSTIYYYWSLRLAFIQWGLPKSIRVDHDSCFYENRSSSPFPKFFHLWLIGLGIELCFIKHKPPIENAVIERSHQTINNQVYKGQQYDCWKSLFKYSNERLTKLNYKLPNRMMNYKAPLEQYPKASHSGRFYNIAQEESMIDFKRIYRYLTNGKWYRIVSKDKTISLGGQVYYLKQAKPRTQIQITFCNRRKKLLFHDVNELLIASHSIKKLSVETVMDANTKELISMLYKLFHRRDCPLQT